LFLILTLFPSAPAASLAFLNLYSYSENSFHYCNVALDVAVGREVMIEFLCRNTPNHINTSIEGSALRWPARKEKIRRINGYSTERSVESEKNNLFLWKGVHHENSQVFDNLFSVMLFGYG
jgi:hypothetical protein